MTDELEVLLEEEEALDRELAELFRKRVYRKRAPASGWEETAASDDAVDGDLGGGVPTGRGLRGRIARLFRRERRDLAGVDRAEADMPQRGAAGESAGGESAEDDRAEEPIESGVYRRSWRDTYRELGRIRNAAEYRKEEKNSRIRLEKESGTESAGGGMDREADRVDRAFQIDARRYDGGFSWQ